MSQLRSLEGRFPPIEIRQPPQEYVTEFTNFVELAVARVVDRRWMLLPRSLKEDTDDLPIGLQPPPSRRAAVRKDHRSDKERIYLFDEQEQQTRVLDQLTLGGLFVADPVALSSGQYLRWLHTAIVVLQQFPSSQDDILKRMTHTDTAFRQLGSCLDVITIGHSGGCTVAALSLDATEDQILDTIRDHIHRDGKPGFIGSNLGTEIRAYSEGHPSYRFNNGHIAGIHITLAVLPQRRLPRFEGSALSEEESSWFWEIEDKRWFLMEDQWRRINPFIIPARIGEAETIFLYIGWRPVNNWLTFLAYDGLRKANTGN